MENHLQFEASRQHRVGQMVGAEQEMCSLAKMENVCCWRTSEVDFHSANSWRGLTGAFPIEPVPPTGVFPRPPPAWSQNFCVVCIHK